MPNVRNREKRSTEKQVQTEIAESRVGSIVRRESLGLNTQEDFLEYLARFADFRVFLPIVCDSRFDLTTVNVGKPRSEALLSSLQMIGRILCAVKALKSQLATIPSDRLPDFRDVYVDRMVRNFVPSSAPCGRMESKFFLAEMPRAGAIVFSKDCLMREAVQDAGSFNLLPLSSRYIEGLPGVVEYYLRYGEALPLFHLNTIKVGQKVTLAALCVALERGDAFSVATHIRAYEQIPRPRFLRLQNKLKRIQSLVVEHLRRSDVPYFRAFLNGRYTVKAPLKADLCTPSVSNAKE